MNECIIGNCIDPIIERDSGISGISDVLGEQFDKAMKKNICDYYRFGCDMYLNEKGKKYKLIVDAMRTAKSNQKTSLTSKTGQRKDLSNKCCFLTLNPAPEVPFGKLFIAVNKIVKLHGIKENAHWCFEQRGISDDDRGKGFHAHIVYLKTEGDTDWELVESKIDSLVSDLYPRGVDEHRLNKMSYNPDIFHEKVMYIKGHKMLKDDTQKELDRLKHIQDAEWRKEMKLDEYYFTKKSLDFQKSAFIFNK